MAERPARAHNEKQRVNAKDNMSKSTDDLGPKVSKNGVLQVQPSALLRNKKVMDQMRQTTAAVKRAAAKGNGEQKK